MLLHLRVTRLPSPSPFQKRMNPDPAINAIIIIAAFFVPQHLLCAVILENTVRDVYHNSVW
jgi:hypothetical protein